MPRFLTIPERIKLFKEINRVHEEIYGSRMLFRCAWGGDYIDIESDVRFDYHGEWVPMAKLDAGKYYFQDGKGKDIPSLQGSYAWQAYYFYHLNPYKFIELGRKKLEDEDLISDGLGNRIRPDISHPVDCLETMVEVQQRKDNGKIWISSNWVYPDCYGSGEGVRGLIYKTLGEATGGDEKIAKDLQAKYEAIIASNGYEFKKSLKRYFSGEKLLSKCWNGGYLFASSKERRIKTLEQLDEALAAEEKHFSDSLEEFIEWFRSNGINLDEEAEEGLRRRMREFYDAYPRNIAKDWCKFLVEEDKVEPSDVYLWWGGEPNSDACYALLALFFEVDPEDISRPRFDKRVSRNLRAIIKIAEKDRTWLWLSYYKEYEPNVWRVIFS